MEVSAGALAGRPLSLSHIRTPLLPVLGALAVFFESLLFLGEVFVVIKNDHCVNAKSGLARLEYPDIGARR